jgi:hypothetical protein
VLVATLGIGYTNLVATVDVPPWSSMAAATGPAFKRALAATLEDRVDDSDKMDVHVTFAAAAPFFLLVAGRLRLTVIQQDPRRNLLNPGRRVNRTIVR